MSGILLILLLVLLTVPSRPSVHVQNFFSLVPLALILGEVTEDLAMRFGDTAGGLLNATFGNVTELILSIAALTKGLNIVVAMSLIGSVLSNMLLVLGIPPSDHLCPARNIHPQVHAGFDSMVRQALRQ